MFCPALKPTAVLKLLSALFSAASPMATFAKPWMLLASAKEPMASFDDKSPVSVSEPGALILNFGF
jgi:hypothetical protein